MKQKNIIIVAAIIALTATVLGWRSTQASHSPRFEPRGICNPNQPFDPHTNGIIHCRNTDPTTGLCPVNTLPDEYPDGLCFPSFNNYRDNNLLHQGVNLFPDERRFMLVRKAIDPSTAFRNETTVSVGERLQFIAYVHNDADPSHNPDDGQTRSLARDVRTRVNSFSFDSTLNNYATTSATSFQINQFITASNTTPREISDEARVTSANGQPIRLQYAQLASDGRPSAKFKFGEPPQYRYFAASDFFGAGAFFGSPNTINNDVFASEEYRGYVYFSVDVVAAPPPPPPLALPRLTLYKRVDNNNNGTLRVEDFPLFVDSQQVTSGQTNTFRPGIYMASEQQRPGYTASTWSGDCAPDGRVTLTLGDNKTCLIINDDIPFFVPPPPLPEPVPVPPLPPASNDVCLDLKILNREVVLDLPPDQEQFLSASMQTSGPNFNGTIVWEHTKDGQLAEPRKTGIRVGLKNITDKSTITAYVIPDPGNVCKDSIKPVKPPPPQPPPQQPLGILAKTAFNATVGSGKVIKKDKNGRGDTAQFEVIFQPQSARPFDVTIKELTRGVIRGDRGGLIEIDTNSVQIAQKENGALRPVPSCASRVPRRGQPALPLTTCFEGHLFREPGLTFRFVEPQITLHITYRGTLTHSLIDERFCRYTLTDREFCGEIFVNSVVDNLNNTPVSAMLYTPCPFLLTQGIGDVLLEEDFRVGSDIYSCARVPNIEGPIIKPVPPPPPPPGPPIKTGPDTPINIPSHDLCKDSNTEETAGDQRPQGYRNPFKSVSSNLCEIAMSVADKVDVPAVRADIAENITRITRYNNNLGVWPASQQRRQILMSNINEPPIVPGGVSPNPNFEVYKVKNADLVINSSHKIDEGARTFIVEDGDLIIQSDIKYGASENGFDLTNLKKVPSVAFIVINGDIKIAPGVRNLAGVFVALKINGKGGSICGTACTSGTESPHSLTIDGTVYGDIEPLFETRTYYGGNPRLGQGTIVIRYDGRLFYNMPPGIKDILQLTPEQIAR